MYITGQRDERRGLWRVHQPRCPGRWFPSPGHSRRQAGQHIGLSDQKMRHAIRCRRNLHAHPAAGARWLELRCITYRSSVIVHSNIQPTLLYLRQRPPITTRHSLYKITPTTEQHTTTRPTSIRCVARLIDDVDDDRAGACRKAYINTIRSHRAVKAPSACRVAVPCTAPARCVCGADCVQKAPLAAAV